MNKDINCENLISKYVSLRKENGISQETVAELTDTATSTISNYERKARIPSLLMFSKMLDSIGYELCIKKKE